MDWNLQWEEHHKKTPTRIGHVPPAQLWLLLGKMAKNKLQIKLADIAGSQPSDSRHLRRSRQDWC